MVTAVNYSVLARAVEYYVDLGYQYVEVPWAVDRQFIDLTAHGRLAPMMATISGAKEETKWLVGSGEQGFLALEHDEATVLPQGKYCTLTPCFRPGDGNRSEFHQTGFMKVELYRTDHVDKYAVDEMIWAASVFMQQELRGEGYHIERHDTPEENYEVPHTGFATLLSADLELNGIEVGSYGLRHCKEVDWAYGTGIAEPRFSQAREKYEYFIKMNPVLSVA